MFTFTWFMIVDSSAPLAASSWAVRATFTVSPLGVCLPVDADQSASVGGLMTVEVMSGGLYPTFRKLVYFNCILSRPCNC